VILTVSLAAALSTGCIIPEAPEYGAPRQTPIFIDPNSIRPNPGNLLHLVNSSGNDVTFQMGIRSEDAGEGLQQVLFIDYKHNGLDYYDQPVEPGTLDKVRTIAEHFTLPDGRIQPGCHTFTLMVMHESGWSRENRQIIGAPPDLASVTWFASMDDPGTQLLSDCPDAASEVSAPATNTATSTK